MPQTIHARPDMGAIPADTTTVPAGDGWAQTVWDRIYTSGSWAEIPVPDKRDERAERRNRSAWMAYGIRPTNILLPQADPLDIRLRLKRFENPEADRRANIRLLVRDIAAADPRRKGIRAWRTRERLSWHVKSRPDHVAEAQQVVAHHDRLEEGLKRRVRSGRMTTDTPGSLAIGVMLAIGAMGFAPEGPYFRHFQIALAALVAVAWAFHAGRERGWKYGYDQAVWHCAEVGVEHAEVTAKERADLERRHALDLERIAEEGRLLTGAAEEALKEHRAAWAEERRARAEMEQAKLANQSTFKRLLATRKMAFKLPRQPKNEGYLYVVGFDTGTVKVGHTEDPKRRLGQHRGEAEAFGVHVTNYWISPSHIDFRGNETRLINACARVSRRTRKEYFHEVGYERAVQFASALTYFSTDTEQTSVSGVWA